MTKNFLILLCCFCLISCQDTKNKSNFVNKSSKKKNNLKKELLSKNEDTHRLDTIKRVKQEQLISFLTEYGKENQETHALIQTSFGDIEIELYKDTPLHRANFIRMAKLGYFDSTYFYRVIEDFVIQGGNSDNEMTNRMRKAIGKFLIPKEFHQKYRHDYGAVSMAKYTKQNVSKASSPYEFFIVMDKNGAHHLDNEHTVFGKVIKGMDVAQKISEVKTTSDDWPENNIEIKVKILDE